MKKQILFLLLAIVANVSLTWAQDPPPSSNASISFDPGDLTALPTFCVEATQVEATCVPSPGPLNPIAGTEYTYTVTVSNAGANPKIHWLVTTEPDFIVAGELTGDIETTPTSDIIMAHGTSYNDPNNTLNEVEITWKSIPAATDVFLVTYVH